MSFSEEWEFAKLIALHDDVQPAEFVMEPNVCRIGRSPSCQIVVQRPIVSRLHARIERDERTRYTLHDANSANGTFVNGFVVSSPYYLQDNDEISFGSSEALLRFEDAEATAPMQISRLRYDKQKMIFLLDGEPLELSPSQFRLLQHLYEHAYEVCTRESCAQSLWGRSYDPVLDSQALDRTMSYLRKAMRAVSSAAELIITRRGVGYMLTLHNQNK